MELFEYILTGIGSAGVVKSFFFFMLVDKDFMVDEYVKEQMEKYMNYQKDVKYRDKAKEFVSWAFNDNFNEETKTRNKNAFYQIKLDVLRTKILDFYFEKIDNLQNIDSTITRTCDVESTLGEYVIQLMRMRMVVEPNIQISRGVHPKSQIPYLYVKSHWIDETGKKVRKFTKVLGHAEDYKLGINDPEAFKNGLDTIQPIIAEPKYNHECKSRHHFHQDEILSAKA